MMIHLDKLEDFVSLNLNLTAESSNEVELEKIELESDMTFT